MISRTDPLTYWLGPTSTVIVSPRWKSATGSSPMLSHRTLSLTAPTVPTLASGFVAWKFSRRATTSFVWLVGGPLDWPPGWRPPHPGTASNPPTVTDANTAGASRRAQDRPAGRAGRSLRAEPGITPAVRMDCMIIPLS